MSEKAQTLACIGDGQLIRMTIPAIKELGYDVVVLGPTQNSPAEQMGARQIHASLTDPEATRELVQQGVVTTWEIEHIDAATLKQLEQEGANIQPSPETVAMIQDKLAQKEFLRSLGIPVADFAAINTREDLQQIADNFGYPYILKSRFGAYDGRGNAVIEKPEDVEEALQKLGDHDLYAERIVPFTKELAVMAARGMSGDIALYPVVETIHKNNICHTVLAPADIDPQSYAQAEELARITLSHLKGASMFGIEMFLTADGQVLINEIAPRVHNSGHYTTDACATSQFENHARAVLGLPLGDTRMLVPAAVMVNVLGERNGPTELTGLSNALSIPNTHVHMYGKSPTKIDRKMGHITATGESLEEARQRAESARRYISI